MKRQTLIVAAVVTFLPGMTACSNTRDVDWGEYSPTVKTRIENMVSDKDCGGLQDEFDTADANSASGSNADLMAYLNDKMEDIGCYE